VVSSQEYKASILQVLPIINNYQITYILSDARELKYIQQANQNWLLRVLVPRLIKTNVEKIASIVSFDLISITINHKLLQLKHSKPVNTALPFDFEAFTEVESAFDWLNIIAPAPVIAIKS
jgi:hypothetical protein